MARLPALPFVRSSVTQGLSASESYRRFVSTAHEQGLTGIRRQDYLRLYSETRAARGTTGAAMAAPRDALPSPELINRRTTHHTTGYGSWVMVYQRPTGGGETFKQPWLIRSSELLTPAEAERRVGQFIAENPYNYGRTVTGIGYMGTDEYTPGVGA